MSKTTKAGMSAGLFVVGQNDLEGVLRGTRGLLAMLGRNGISLETAWMPGFGHFYPMGATSLGNDMYKLTLRARTLRFVERTLSKP